MTAAAVLAATAAVLLLWPRPVGHRRLGASVGRRRFTVDPGWAMVAAPVVALVLVGPAAAVAATIVAGTVFGLRRRAARRTARDRVRDDLRRAVSIMIAEMSVGAPVGAACAGAATELASESSPIAAELAAMAARAQLGGEPVPSAVDGSDVARLSAAWAASAARGLPMADLLGMLRADLTARADHATRTRAGLAGPRATAMILAILPILGIGLGHLMGAAPLAVLFGSGLGGILLVIGTALAAAGVWWTDAITAKALR